MELGYSVARMSIEEGGWVSINEYNTYSEADMWLDHYADIYDHSIVEIIPTGQCVQYPMGWDAVTAQRPNRGIPKIPHGRTGISKDSALAVGAIQVSCFVHFTTLLLT